MMGAVTMSEIHNLNNARWVYPLHTNGAARGANGSALLESGAERAADEVEISAAGAQLADAVRTSRAVPRLSKVARIRAEIQNGTYDVDGKLAAILPRVLADALKS
jgi:anti-sigma28 factor (negative regulator of flagellin synthesis)